MARLTLNQGQPVMHHRGEVFLKGKQPCGADERRAGATGAVKRLLKTRTGTKFSVFGSRVDAALLSLSLRLSNIQPQLMSFPWEGAELSLGLQTLRGKGLKMAWVMASRDHQRAG